jgi:hypothetical protein
VTQVSYEKAALSKEVDVKESELKAWKSKFEASEKAKANVDNEIIKLTHIIKMSCK